jgi:YYY domain-containing protein
VADDDLETPQAPTGSEPVAPAEAVADGEQAGAETVVPSGGDAPQQDESAAAPLSETEEAVTTLESAESLPEETPVDAGAAVVANGNATGNSRWARWLPTIACLLAILAAGAYLRLTGVDWDQGQHLHPDERFLTMVASSLQRPADLLGYLDSTTSSLNPRNTGHEFFVYGTWPVTMVYLVAERLGETSYDQVYLVGRRLGALLDLIAVLLLFVLGTRLADRRVGLLAAALGAFAAFGIQLSHFYTVETATNVFVLLFLVGMVEAVVHRRPAFYAVAGIGLGLALASKIAVWLLVPVALIVMWLDWRRRRREGSAGGWGRLLLHVLVLGIVSFVTLRVADPTMFAGPGWPNVVENPALYAEYTGPLACGSSEAHLWCKLEALMPSVLEPYLLPDPRFMHNIQQIQDMVTGYGIDWPPNHQWFGRLAYLFPLKNMVLWGMGIPLGVMAWLAWAAVGLLLVRRKHLALLLPWLWVTVVFAYQGFQWTKTMRYFFPIYPALIVLAAWAMVATYDWAKAGSTDRPGVLDRLRRPVWVLAGICLVLGGTMLWGWMVSRIYTRDHTRVQASRWIYHNIPTAMGLTVAEGPPGWRYMPANHSQSLTFSGNEWTLPADQPSEPARVLVPGKQSVTVDGAQLSRVITEGASGRRTVRAWLSSSPTRGPDERPEKVLATGEVTVEVGQSPTDIHVPWTPVTLTSEGELQASVQQTAEAEAQPPAQQTAEATAQPSEDDEVPLASEYYVWFEVTGGDLSGTLPIVAFESTWDDVVPVGMDGYGRFDNPDTAYGEGFYGESNLDLYAEDDPGKFDLLTETLAKSDYIVSSSNRVYGSTERMPSRYPATNEYYRRLFAGQLGFREIADITSFPSLGPFTVDDQSAEEAWHVYDHPRVVVWEKTADYDPAAVRASLLPLTAQRKYTFPERPKGILGQAIAAGKQFLHPFTPDAAAVEAASQAAEAPPDLPTQKPLAAVMLTEAQRERQRVGGTWSSLFDPASLVNQQPALAILWWYLLLFLTGVIAFPLVMIALPNLRDRGWAVSRAAGLLLVSWLAWLVASTGRVPHTSLTVWAAWLVVLLVGGLVAWHRRRDLDAFLRARWRLLAIEELVFATLFVVFLAIRMGNPDIWHPYFGGEKPMDFAYLNAVLRSVSFPAYDPWFAGGKLNYYYYGFVFVGALIKLSGIVPWLAYNLAIPSLAAMTGLGVFGVTQTWVRRLGRRGGEAVVAGLLGAVLAVLSGNLFQVTFIMQKLREVAPTEIGTIFPFVNDLRNLAVGWWMVVRGEAALSVPTHHWYWNASRAIPDGPITEFPFFTFVYADLHAHMMAMPIAMVAFAAALSWALPAVRRNRQVTPARLWWLARLLLAALAIGALWPTNTWDYPTYGAVAGLGIAAGAWQRYGRPGGRWLLRVLATGGLLLGLSLLLFRPYHAAYVQPYGSFKAYTDIRTTLGPFLTVHGIFLFAIGSWAVVALYRAWQRHAERERILAVGGATFAGAAIAFGYLWWSVASEQLPGTPQYPSPWVPLLAVLLLTIGMPLAVLRRATSATRFMAFLFVLGVLLTQFVEYVVLDGDIGRMNTVFKFYIQIWLIWAALAAVSVAWLLPYLRGYVWWRVPVAAPAAPDEFEEPLEGAEAENQPLAASPKPAQPHSAMGTVWLAVFGLLLLSGLTYTVTAARAKVQDRWDAVGMSSDEERKAFDAAKVPGLSGIDYQDYAKYDDDGHILSLRYDRDAIQWLLANVEGTPTILEGFREAGYRWGARYSINTGLPAVIGWDWHQKQQRNAVGGQYIDERTADVRTMYDTTDVSEAEKLLDKYGVELIIVGEMEQAFYNAAGLAKFDQMVSDGRLTQIYPAADSADTPVRIYRRPPATASASP